MAHGGHAWKVWGLGAENQPPSRNKDATPKAQPMPPKFNVEGWVVQGGLQEKKNILVLSKPSAGTFT